MKEIKAYIKPHKLSDVTLALHKVEGLSGISVMDVRGCGRLTDGKDRHTTNKDIMDYAPHIKLEIICNDDIADIVIATIQKSAHTGLYGDGKIYISTIDDAVRISTAQRGRDAV